MCICHSVIVPQRYQRRVLVCQAYGHDGAMARFSKVWDDTNLWACSGDEIDPSTDEHVITTLKWRNPALRERMETLDRLHLTVRFPDGKNASAGNFVATRFDPLLRDNPEMKPERYNAKPPKGLPENFYNIEWLAGLTSAERHKLKMQPPLDFTFSNEILE